ncbi:uncharacterized protein LOC116729963 isoform X1 [Xiphophorus hellerii]|uniref:uncharacterized protein LOC116729963 isoform X1 n=1 Tax=Xiphophorus hellerii TaxID=8084 RepID=UPI0013B38A23|nr:uncharacterized protein LOC116729963 isoform X1 [Xiphophorus hellerii]XP_032434783.1 uncharacterized protein LOC116729963 isoform X1 [Xiphophorus hellerii]
MSKSDRVVLVLGGAGTVGSGIVKALLDKGFKAAVISRDGGRLEKLRAFVSPSSKDNLIAVVGNVGSEVGAQQAKQQLLQQVGKVTDVVSALGFSWWQGGPPHTQTLQDLHWVLDALLFSTFVSWKTFFPLVRDDPSCSYTFITGGAGEQLLMPGTGFLTVGAASALAFCQVLRDEYPQVDCRLCQFFQPPLPLQQVKINTGVATPERLAPGYLNHLDLGVAVATLVEQGSSSHRVFTVCSPADLQTQLLDGSL